MATEHAGQQCCCRWGCAYPEDGEPEFPCFFCERHQGAIMASSDTVCRRHGREQEAHEAAEEATWD